MAPVCGLSIADQSGVTHEDDSAIEPLPIVVIVYGELAPSGAVCVPALHSPGLQDCSH